MNTWQTHLTALITGNDFSTQGEIVAALNRDGFEVNQTTVSRALKKNGIGKNKGIYEHLIADTSGVIFDVKVTRNRSLVVVHTQPAFAGVVAQRVDEANLACVLGTIAGDDTIFIAINGPEALEQLARTLPWAPLLGQ
jgi:transcriptional regulator of arginine metabolism